MKKKTKKKTHNVRPEEEVDARPSKHWIASPKEVIDVRPEEAMDIHSEHIMVSAMVCLPHVPTGHQQMWEICNKHSSRIKYYGKCC